MRSLDLYLRLVVVQIRSQMQYRMGFLLETISVGINSLISFLTLALVLQKFEGVAGWTLGEVAFLYAMVETAFGVMDMLFSGFDPDFFAAHIRIGTFDQILLRPINPTLQVFGSQFLLRRLGRIIQGLLVFAVALHLTDIHWTAAKVLYLPVVLVSMVAFFGGLFIAGSTITFWTIERIEAVNILTYGGAEMMSYPMTIYQEWIRRFFTFVVPAIFLNYFPALYFLDKPDPFNFPAWSHFLAPAAGFVVLFAALLFWEYGIQHYQSTGT